MHAVVLAVHSQALSECSERSNAERSNLERSKFSRLALHVEHSSFECDLQVVRVFETPSLKKCKQEALSLFCSVLTFRRPNWKFDGTFR